MVGQIYPEAHDEEFYISRRMCGIIVQYKQAGERVRGQKLFEKLRSLN